jgi:putative DNA primase/helicase
MSSENTEETSQQQQELPQAEVPTEPSMEQLEKQALELVMQKPPMSLVPRDPRQDLVILDFEDNDSGNADKFLYMFGERLAFCGRTRQWYVYDGRRWLKDANGHELQRLLEVFYHRVLLLFTLPDLSPAQLARKKSLLRLGNCVVRDRLLQAAEAKTKFDSKRFNQARHLLVTATGVVDLTNGVPHLCERGYFLTQQTELLYDFEVPAPQRFLCFLKEIFNDDQELIDYVQKVLGYCLTGETKEQCLFIFLGSGSNGKSVLLNLLKRMLPEYVQTLALSSLAEKRDYGAPNSSLVAAKDARVLLVNELNKNMRLDENLIKTATGEDTVVARSIYQAEVEFKPQFKLILTVNHFPQVNWDDYAWERRIRLIPFNHTFTGKEIDRELPEKLWAEREGILRWLVQGAERWYAEGLDAQPEKVQRQLWQMQMDSPSFCDFYKHCLEVTGKEEDVIQASELYRLYREWCGGLEETEQDYLSLQKFGRRLAQNKVGKKIMGRSRCTYYLGVRLKETLAAAEPQEEAEIYGT